MIFTDSILYPKGDLSRLQSWGCCEELTNCDTNYDAIVPMKNFLSHKDVTKQYSKWLQMLQELFEIPLTYELIEKRTVKGWLTFKHFEEIRKESTLRNYSIGDKSTIRVQEKHKGVIERRKDTSLFVNENNIYMGVYSGHILFSLSYSSGQFYKNEDLFSYEIPFMNIMFEKTWSSMKYLHWYLVRLYANSPYVCNFLIDFKEEVEEIVNEYNTSWFNILFYLSKVVDGDYFLYDYLPIKKVTYDELKEKSTLGGYNRSFYDILPHFGEYNSNVRVLTVKDNIHGKVTEEESKIILESLKKLTKRCTQ